MANVKVVIKQTNKQTTKQTNIQAMQKQYVTNKDMYLGGACKSAFVLNFKR